MPCVILHLAVGQSTAMSMDMFSFPFYNTNKKFVAHLTIFIAILPMLSKSIPWNGDDTIETGATARNLLSLD